MQSGIGALNDPSASIPPQLASILVRRSPVVGASRDDRFDPSLDQHVPNLVAVVTAIRKQTLGSAAPGPAPATACVVQRRLKEPDFRRCCLLHVYSERSTLAIGQHHELCFLAFFSRPHQCAPFLAGINRPSMKHSSHCTWCRSSNWSRKARHRSNSTPDSAHAFSRRWTVLFEPYFSGHSPHRAPVHKIHRIPSKHRRSSTGGRPPALPRLPRGSRA